MALAKPEQPWEPFQGINHISNLARSGVVAVSHLTSNGWIEADPPSQPSLPLARGAHAATTRPSVAGGVRCVGEAAAHHHAAG